MQLQQFLVCIRHCADLIFRTGYHYHNDHNNCVNNYNNGNNYGSGYNSICSAKRNDRRPASSQRADPHRYRRTGQGFHF